jgi:hypothetical protein
MLNETDRRFIGLLMFLGSIAVLIVFQQTWGTVAGIILWAASLLWMAQPLPHREESYEAYRKQTTPLDEPYRSNLAWNRRPRPRRATRSTALAADGSVITPDATGLTPAGAASTRSG